MEVFELITLNPEGIYEFAVSKAGPAEALPDELIAETNQG
jgi:hypothetical protein